MPQLDWNRPPLPTPITVVYNTDDMMYYVNGVPISYSDEKTRQYCIDKFGAAYTWPNRTCMTDAEICTLHEPLHTVPDKERDDQMIQHVQMNTQTMQYIPPTMPMMPTVVRQSLLSKLRYKPTILKKADAYYAIEEEIHRLAPKLKSVLDLVESAEGASVSRVVSRLSNLFESEYAKYKYSMTNFIFGAGWYRALPTECKRMFRTVKRDSYLYVYLDPITGTITDERDILPFLVNAYITAKLPELYAKTTIGIRHTQMQSNADTALGVNPN